PLMTMSCVSLRESSEFHRTSRRRLGSRGKMTDALRRVLSGPATSVQSTVSAPKTVVSLAWLESFAKTPAHFISRDVAAGEAAACAFGAVLAGDAGSAVGGRGSS